MTETATAPRLTAQALRQELRQALMDYPIGAILRHIRSDDLYVVRGAVVDEADKRVRVRYSAFADPDIDWTRPVDDFPGRFRLEDFPGRFRLEAQLPPVDVGRVVLELSRATGCPPRMIYDSRQKDAAALRCVAYYLTRLYRPDLSTPEIGRAFKRDHTTILRGLQAGRHHADTGYRDVVVTVQRVLGPVPPRNNP